MRELQKYLVNQVQEVYRLQGVDINDKHIEIIVRQMLEKVRVIDPGDTRSSMAKRWISKEFEWRNPQASQKRAANPRKRSRVLARDHQGLARQPNLSLSAASFQDTTRVLTEAAYAGKTGLPARLQGERDHGSHDSRRHWLPGTSAAQAGGKRQAVARQ